MFCEISNIILKKRRNIKLAKKTKAKRKSTRQPNPVVLSINVCDTIIRDEPTKKVSLIGLFSAINAITFPATHPSMHVYIALTNGHGSYKLNIQLVREEDNHIIVGMEGGIKFMTPLQVLELNLQWGGIQFEKPGFYHFEVICNGTLAGARKFIVSQIQQQNPHTKETKG